MRKMEGFLNCCAECRLATLSTPKSARRTSPRLGVGLDVWNSACSRIFRTEKGMHLQREWPFLPLNPPSRASLNRLVRRCQMGRQDRARGKICGKKVFTSRSTLERVVQGVQETCKAYSRLLSISCISLPLFYENSARRPFCAARATSSKSLDVYSLVIRETETAIPSHREVAGRASSDNSPEMSTTNADFHLGGDAKVSSAHQIRTSKGK